MSPDKQGKPKGSAQKGKNQKAFQDLNENVNADKADKVKGGFNPQPDPPGVIRAFNPQPDPPAIRTPRQIL